VVADEKPMVKDGYGADNAKLLVDHFENFATHAVGNGTSFLAIVWFQNVHVQYTAVAEYTSKYPLSNNTTQQQQDYWGSLSALDAQVGRVRQILKKLKIAEDTALLALLARPLVARHTRWLLSCCPPPPCFKNTFRLSFQDARS
jgi:hypothetical protein